MKIGIVDLSGDSRVTQDGLVRIAAALMRQANEHFAGWWESASCTIGVFSTLASVPADYWPFQLVKTLSDPNALACHTVDAQGRPSLYCGTDVIFDNGGTLSSGSNSISAAMSHEVLEAIADAYVDFWCDFPDGSREVALEVADPVEGDSYNIDGVAVSNFVGPRWFRTGAGPYDFMGKVTIPFTMSPGGYWVERSGGPNGTSKQVFGDAMPEWKRAHKSKFSRRIRKARATSAAL